MIQKKREASEIDQLKHESQVAKKAFEDKIRNLEFELDERTHKITVGLITYYMQWLLLVYASQCINGCGYIDITVGLIVNSLSVYETNKAGYAATPVARGWTGVMF